MNIWLEGHLSRLLWAIPEAQVNLNQLASCFRGMGWKENLWKRKPDTESPAPLLGVCRECEEEVSTYLCPLLSSYENDLV